jgi:hypothetical protein
MRVKGAFRRESHLDLELALIPRDPPLPRFLPRLPPCPSGASLGGRWLLQVPPAHHGARSPGYRSCYPRFPPVALGSRCAGSTIPPVGLFHQFRRQVDHEVLSTIESDLSSLSKVSEVCHGVAL